MSWRDRDYNRGGGRGSLGHPILDFLNGSVSLGHWFGIHVRVHASLIIVIVLTLLIAQQRGYGLQARAISMAALFVIILLHEFGHCFAARSVGGEANEILMWPLGGLAYAQAPHRPWPTFVTVAGGPLVNVVICAICGVWLLLSAGFIPLNPFRPLRVDEYFALTNVTYYVWWVYYMSYYLLLFNLLPIYPLDGGQALQSILWPRMGYYRSMMFSTKTGMIGAVVLGVYGLLTLNFLLLLVAINGFMVCRGMRFAMQEAGPEGFHDAVDYSASLRDEPVRKRISRRAIRRAQKREREERLEQERIDAILEKVSAHGMQSLSWFEKRALRKATERQRQRDLESSRRRGY